PAGAAYYLLADVRELKLRDDGPTAGPRPLIQGNYHGGLDNTSGSVTLTGKTDVVIASTTFVAQAEAVGIVISEINYHPHEPTAAELAILPGLVAEDFEFIELLNTHPTDTINLANMSLANGLDFTFGNVSLAPGE